MLSSDTLCQVSIPPQAAYQCWLDQREHMDVLYRQLLEAPALNDIDRTSIILFWLYLDQYGDQAFGRTPKSQAPAFAQIRNRISDWPQNWQAFYQCYRLLRLRPQVEHALELWRRRTDIAYLSKSIPSAVSVWRNQQQGKRPVGIFPSWVDRQRKVDRHQGALAFLAHDLEHLYHFTVDADLYLAQVGFFRWLHLCYPEGAALAREHHAWRYLISDMNTHPIHSLASLQAFEHSLPETSRKNWPALGQKLGWPAHVTEELIHPSTHHPRPGLIEYWRGLGQMAFAN